MAKLLSTQNIQNNAATYAKLQQASVGNVLLGRYSGTSGNVQEILLGTNLSFSGTVLNASGGATYPSVAANDSNLTFNSTSLDQLACLPTTNRTYTLNSSFTAGQTISFKNIATADANYITIVANDASTIAILPATGTITITALNNSPATNTSWKVISRKSGWIQYSPSLPSFSSTTNVLGTYQVQDNMLMGFISFSFVTGSGSIDAQIGIPSAFTIDSNASLSKYYGEWHNTNVGNSGSSGMGFMVYYNSTSIGMTPAFATFSTTVGSIANHTYPVFLDFRIPIVY